MRRKSELLKPLAVAALLALALHGGVWASGFSGGLGAVVTSVAGTTSQVSVSASTGSVTLSLPQNFDTAAVVTLGSVTSPIVSGTQASFASYFAKEFTLTSSANITVDWSQGNFQTLQLVNGTNPIFTFTGGQAGGRYWLTLIQPASGTCTVTWPGSAYIYWPGGSAPTLTATSSRIDVICFGYSGVVGRFVGASSLDNH